MNPPAGVLEALTTILPHIAPEAILGMAACVVFLGATVRPGRDLWGCVALVSLALATLAACFIRSPVYGSLDGARSALFAGPLVLDPFTHVVRFVVLIGGAVLLLLSWEEVEDAHAAEHHACLLLIIAGVSLTTAANELVTLFLALELVSIPTYVLLYLTRSDKFAQEAAMKYFLLSVFSSSFLLFGFSYLYGITGTTNLAAIHEALAGAQEGLPGLAVVALVMVVAALGFRMTAVPFHFYAPDVYQGTSTSAAALLSFLPKVTGFTALIRILGLVPLTLQGVAGEARSAAFMLADQSPVLLWIIAAVTMSLGNVLGLLQDNVKRMLAYSSVAHAGYMLIGIAVAPKLLTSAGVGSRGVDAVLFYLVAYGAMTIGAFAVLSSLNTPTRPVETVDDLAGLAGSHPGTALFMTLFLFSLLGMPLTAGFCGKVFLFLSALGVPTPPAGSTQDNPLLLLQFEQANLFRILALVAVINSAIGAWFYLRIIAVMFLREPLNPVAKRRAGPALAAVWICAVVTLVLGVWPGPLKRTFEHAAPAAMVEDETAGVPTGQRSVAAREP